MPAVRLLLLLLLLLTSVAQATAVAGALRENPTAVAGVLRVIPTSEGATVRLALSQPLQAPPRAFALMDPLRWAIDLSGASSTRREAAGGPLPGGPVKAARVSQFDPATVRLVVEFSRPMQLIETFQDKGQALELRFREVDAASFRRQVSRGRSPIAGFLQEAPRAVPPGPAPPADLEAESAARLDAVEAALAEASRSMQPPAPPEVSRSPQASRSPQVQPQPPLDTRRDSRRPPPAALPPRETPVASARPSRRGKSVVVIDAGHGGRDPGAPAVTGGTEKEVTLAIAQKTRRAIERRAREQGVAVEVRLTRDDDRFITLAGRVRLARQWGADLFISIHADSAPNIEARGASVYTLSEIASDREAARVAAKENRADLIAGVDLSRESRDVASILVDLGRRDSMNASADFAEALQNGMEPEGVRFRSQFHRFANFQVLRNLGVPAVLLETGFLSNVEDSRTLQSARGQQAIADGIASAVVSHVAAHARAR